MPNAIAHRVGAALLTGGCLWAQESQEGGITHKPFSGALLAAVCTNIPDMLEPAIHPHHRQFFHSLVFAGLVASGMYEAYNWSPETDFDKFVRFCLLGAGAGILVHLAMDFATPRSLPVFGKV